MWRNYFGSKAIIYGVDIAPECRTYENDTIKSFIGEPSGPFVLARVSPKGTNA
jgi:hypothetical protein